MNMEPQVYDFSYLKSWTNDELKTKLASIVPIIDFLMNMHNAKDKVVKMELSCVPANAPEWVFDLRDPDRFAERNNVKELTLYFDTLKLFNKVSGLNFPQELEIFIHNFCTFLCAQKMHIEVLLTT